MVRRVRVAPRVDFMLRDKNMWQDYFRWLIKYVDVLNDVAQNY